MTNNFKFNILLLIKERGTKMITKTDAIKMETKDLSIMENDLYIKLNIMEEKITQIRNGIKN